MSKKTVIIKPGETFILPKNATIEALILDGAINVESTCDNLPTPSSYICGYFKIVCDVDSNPGHSMDELHTFYNTLYVGGNQYVMNRSVLNGDNPGSLTSISELNTFVPDQVLFSFKSVVRDVLDKRQYVYVYFKAPESIWDTISLKIDNWETNSIYYPIEHDCDDYPNNI